MNYHSYLLRIWRTQLNGKHIWRISLQDTKTEHKVYMTSMDGLVEYLQAQINNGLTQSGHEKDHMECD